jgi:hypothetical protein
MTFAVASSLYFRAPDLPARGECHDRYAQEASVRLLLTSGVTNTRIRDALVGLLGKPIADSSALCIPTAEWGHPMCMPASAWRFIAGRSPSPMCDLGWKSVGVLELTAHRAEGPPRQHENWLVPRAESNLTIAGQTPLMIPSTECLPRIKSVRQPPRPDSVYAF